ncbi:response regulator [Trinickia mobilis]|uniref:response regulator n=1 Tax=Trinickia mobilis TaxID=2816356 RepID=UPI001A8DF6E0|nr:response regulator [Trinickia mobilis]
MKRSPSILVATHASADAELVARLLADEFDNVRLSTKPEFAVSDFEKHLPSILILSFDTLEEAERYYLGLYRLSKVIHTVPHKTIILCNKDDLWRVYDLCKKQQFDDYVLFWPVTNDAPRLRMAVHHAVRLLEPLSPDAVMPGQLAAHARRMATLEPKLAEFTRQFAQEIDNTTAAAIAAERAVDFAFGLAPDAKAGPARGAGTSDANSEPAPASADLRQQLRSVGASVEALRRVIGNLTGAIAPQLEAARTMRGLAERMRPVVLAVDDDDFQRKLLHKLLSGAEVDLAFAASGAEALAMMWKRRPDLVFMDVELPDLNGVEVTRRLKAVEQFAEIPVIITTGHSQKAIVMESLTAGAADFLVKPFDRAILLDKLKTFLPGSVDGSTQPEGGIAASPSVSAMPLPSHADAKPADHRNAGRPTS